MSRLHTRPSPVRPPSSLQECTCSVPASARWSCLACSLVSEPEVEKWTHRTPWTGLHRWNSSELPQARNLRVSLILSEVHADQVTKRNLSCLHDENVRDKQTKILVSCACCDVFQPSHSQENSSLETFIFHHNSSSKSTSA